MATKYTCEFYSENVDASGNDQKWKIDIDSASWGGDAEPFKSTSEGFSLNMDGGDDSFLAPIKTTSLNFSMLLENATLEGIIDDLQAVATGNEDDFSVAVYNYYDGAYRLYWVGYLLGDLVTLEDTSINRILSIKAVDGLNRLKYIPFDHTAYGGARSMLNLIKLCLSPLTLTASYFGATSAYIAHNPFYYNEGMLGGSTWNSTWGKNINNDPLALTKVNSIVFKDDDGKWWSYYKVLEQVLSAFQLRIYFTQLNYQATGVDSHGMWFIQSPLVNHGNSNNSSYDSTQLVFYHKKSLTTDIALSYDNAFNQSILNVSTRAAGGLEMFLPPLLSYKSIYEHSIFNNLIFGPYSWSSTSGENAGANVHYSQTQLMNIDLSGKEDTAPIGWTDDANQVSQQRIMITGSITTDVIDAFTVNGLGYTSGKEYWLANGFTFSGFTVAVDSGYHFPRMGVRVSTVSEGDSVPNVVKNFWLGDARFAFLFGSVSWLGGTETSAYSSNYAGYDNTASGLKYNIAAAYPSTVYVDDNDVALWGQDMTPETFWFATEAVDSDPEDNDFAWVAPTYNEHNINIVNSSGSWDGYMWNPAVSNGTFQNSTLFSITSARIPWNREDSSADYGWSYIQGIEIFLGLYRDVVVEDGGNTHYTCCKDWTVNRELLCHDRGVQFAYSYNDVRVYLLGGWAGADSFDHTVAWWENDNGSCSDEDVQSPEIIIGDEPSFNPYADVEASEGFGGEYLGQFGIYTAADATGTSVSGAAVNNWRTIHQSDSEDMKLHIKRAKQALAHRYILKYKLELNVVDRNTNFNMSRFGFSNLLYWNSGDWYQNSESANLAFMPTGGTFTAGTGAWKIVLEDCVTYSKDNLTDKSYSSDD